MAMIGSPARAKRAPFFLLKSAILISLSSICPTALTDTVQIHASRDNTLYEDETGSLSNGGGQHLFAGRTLGLTGTPELRRGLIAFDIAGAIPASSEITGVTLTLRMSRTISGAQTVTLHRVEADWGEGDSDAEGGEGMGAPVVSAEATWIHRFHDTELWTTRGGDFTTAASASLPVAGTGFHAWGSTPLMIADVQGWLDSPAANFGWLLRGDELTVGSAKRFDSRENLVSGNRPVLTVEFTDTDGMEQGNEIVQYLLGMRADPLGLDANGDGVVDVADIVFTILLTNHPPSIPPRGIYRAYPGHSIQLPIGATDPEGDDLSYVAESLPAGAQLDEQTGVLSWVPGVDQLGPEYVHFTVSDNAAPPLSAEGVLIFQIVPLDDCTEALCDPALGCVFVPVGLEVNCCAGSPEERVAEPEAGCPEGRVLHVGRNRRGFGRLLNCDFVQVVPFPQGGANVTLHFEARCVNVAEPVTIEARLETADTLAFDLAQTATLQTRSDGFSHALGLSFPIGFSVDVFALEGAEALLTATLTDADDVVVQRLLRIVLTLNDLEDLPNPDRIVTPGGEVGCIGCHRPLNPITGVRSGIEEPHPWYPLTCTECHGGNNTVNAFEEAHVFPPSGPTYLRDLAYDRLNLVDLLYLQFVNPGDFRVAQAGCGSANPADPGSGCHQGLVDSAPFSVMANYAGHYKLPRFLAGGQDRDPIFGCIDITDVDYDPLTAPEGTVASLEALREPEVGVDRSELIATMDIYVPRSCPTCHLSDFGVNDAPGKYRSSGCSACHMVYDDDGLSQSPDPAIVGFFPPHPIGHELTTAIPTEQCAHCHFQGGRVGLMYRGIREGGFPPHLTPPNAVPIGQSLYGHGPDFYFTDEDDTNAVDETPPDLHMTAGMVCADCHIGRDVHGDGFIYSSERYQVGIVCEDCHGTVHAAIQEDPGDGFFHNSAGYPHRRIRRAQDGRILLDLAMETGALEIPQIHDILQSGSNPRMVDAMGVRPSGFAHPDQLECYACHTAWRQTCLGCHVTVNDDLTQYNRTTGETTQGAISVSRDFYSNDFYTLGVNHRGRIVTQCASMHLFITYINNLQAQYVNRVRTTNEGDVGFGWNPFNHHASGRIPMNCDTCHPVDSVETPPNQAQLDETYGFGTGEFILTDGDGTDYDLTAFLNASGELIGSYPHPNTGPVPAASRERALSILVQPHPR